MERVLIIGNSGCGKSTLAKALSEKLNLPLVHLDALFWRDHWQNVSKEEFDALLLKALAAPKWIIDGNYSRTLPLRLDYCDTVIYMDFPRIRCIYGALKRVMHYYGKTRPDMGRNCPERFDWEFLKFIWNFDKKHNYDILSSRDDIRVIILKNRRQVSAFLRQW